ncbi:UDP-N-acetylmuramate:L-alanyl-gamma-D-glutamyl-meso-diaminopimelate ligase [candidate division KSB1 bacterium]|nr:UDP-N-acetylmuramate:L-alanyl-gamma-D-glutamyl-meso-diaminopimelate ligase [candidate division KSB1 bacterium]
MASLAAMLKQMDYHVTGSDEGIYPPMSTFLEQEKIPVKIGFLPEHLDPRPDLVIVGNAISRGNVEIETVLDQHIPYMSLPEALREFCIRGKRSIVITGTHGKTTTTSLVAWIFNHANRQPGFLIGGIPRNFNRGYQVGTGNDFIIEGDEYDSAFFDKAAKFLRFMPDIGVINCIEFDHADIYNSIDEILLAFKRFVNLIPRNGLLVVSKQDTLAVQVSKNAFCRVETFGPGGDWYARNVKISSQQSFFVLYHKDQPVGEISVPLFGAHNINNVLASIAVAHHAGITLETVSQALKLFKGIKRRLELVASVENIDIYDDFGHHPTAILATLKSFRQRFPQRKIWALFEPRTATTRRNIFQELLVDAFMDADCILVAPIHRPEKVPEDQLLSCEQLVNDLSIRKKTAEYFKSINHILDYLSRHLQKGDLVVTFSNGSFSNIHGKLIDRLSNMR